MAKTIDIAAHKAKLATAKADLKRAQVDLRAAEKTAEDRKSVV